MHINKKNKKSMFDTKGELYYHMIVEMGLGIDNQQHLYNQNTGDRLTWRDRFIKCDVNDQPVYAGKNEVIFSLDENFSLFMNMYSYFLDSLTQDEDSDIVVVAHYSDYNEDTNLTRVSVKYNNKDGTEMGKVIQTSLYYDPWLCYVESIFLLNGNDGFDLHNFDHVRERK